MGSELAAVISLGDAHFDPSGREVIRGGQTTRLSPKAAAVLNKLAQERGRVWSRDELLDQLWPAVSVCEEVLTHAIAEIRKALGDNPRAPRFVETVHKMGYRLKVDEPSPPALGVRGLVAPVFDLAGYAACLDAEAVAEQGRRRGNERAIAKYMAVVEQNPNFVRARSGLAKALLVSAAYYDGGEARLQLAKAQCEAALALDPECAEAIAVLGVLPLLRGDFESGQRRFAHALSLAPDSFEVHELIGRACYAVGKHGLAASLLDRASLLNQQDCHAPLLAGKAKLSLGDPTATQSFARALALAERRLADNPDDMMALQVRADALWRLGRMTEALALVRESARRAEAASMNAR